MYHYVYRTVCLTNGKTYTGVRSSKRWPTEDGYLGSGKALGAAILRYGRAAFLKQVLVIAQTREEAARIEAALVTIEVVQSDQTYNLCRGGLGGPWGYRHRPESIAKLIGNRNALGHEVSNESRLRMSLAKRGRVLLKETREKVRRARLAAGISPEERARINAGIRAYWTRMGF